ncbi:MAG: septum formation initiator family protein [Sphingomonadaceae bacterium]|nr:septum formation initiator family protein [Sphingomonadaceae bacterium]
MPRNANPPKIRSRRPSGAVLLSIAGGIVIATWLLFGSTGVFAWSDYRRELAASRVQLAELKAERVRLINRKRLLNPHHVDPDLADEMLRGELNYVHPDDIVIPLHPQR